MADGLHTQATAPTTVITTAESTRRWQTSCASGTCPDCGGTGLVGTRVCTRDTQWLRRVGYGQLFGTAA